MLLHSLWMPLGDCSRCDFSESKNQVRQIDHVIESEDPWRGCDKQSYEYIQDQMEFHCYNVNQAVFKLGDCCHSKNRNPESHWQVLGETAISKIKKVR